MPAQSSSSASKKSKIKANADSLDASKQIVAKIAQLELETAGEKDNDAEIDREVRKANRELCNLLSTIETPLARLEAVREKYLQLFAEMKRIEREHQKSKRRADQLQKERDSARLDLTKANSLKDKLAKMSRENVSENKQLKSTVQRLEGMEAKCRQEVHERLDRMVTEVDNVIKCKQSEGFDQVSDGEDLDFRNRFRSFIEQYELRELQFISLLRIKELEVQYHSAKAEQQRKSQEIEYSKSNQLTRQVSTFSQTESELRSQLNIYVEKFKQVENTLNNSNDLFLTFRKEMEEMSKKTKRLEKENLMLTRKQEATNRNIIDMAEEQTRTQRELESLRKTNENLEKLCRVMQAQGRDKGGGGESVGIEENVSDNIRDENKTRRARAQQELSDGAEGHSFRQQEGEDGGGWRGGQGEEHYTQDPHVTREVRETADMREGKETQDMREAKDTMDSRVTNETKDRGATKETKASLVTKKTRANRAVRESEIW